MAGGACTAEGPWPSSGKSLLIAHPRLSTRDLRDGARRKGTRRFPPPREVRGAGVRAAPT